MAVKRIVAPERFIQALADTKVTDGSTSVRPGATTLEYDGDMYITYDGVNWVPKLDSIRGRMKTVTASLPLASLNAYAANDILTNSTAAGTTFAFPAILRADGAYGYITGAKISFDTTAVTPRTSMFLFNAVPTGGTIRDNVLNLHITATDLAKYQGKIDWVATETLNSGASEALASPSTYGNLPISVKGASGADDLYGVLVTRDIVTLGTGGTATVSLTVEQY